MKSGSGSTLFLTEFISDFKLFSKEIIYGFSTVRAKQSSLCTIMLFWIRKEKKLDKNIIATY